MRKSKKKAVLLISRTKSMMGNVLIDKALCIIVQIMITKHQRRCTAALGV